MYLLSFPENKTKRLYQIYKNADLNDGRDITSFLTYFRKNQVAQFFGY